MNYYKNVTSKYQIKYSQFRNLFIRFYLYKRVRFHVRVITYSVPMIQK